MKFYIGDWEQDLNACSLQTEAAWLKIIVKMFKDNSSGVYKTSTKRLQNLWKCSTNDVTNIIQELKEENICNISIDGESIVFVNRRMIKDKEISKIRREAVKNRYESTNDLQNEKICSTKPPTKDIQNHEYEYEPEFEYEYDIEQYWNANTKEIPKIKSLTDTRKKALRSRVQEHGIEIVKDVIAYVCQNPFMNGENESGWKASFDWVMKKQNFQKIIEGNYESSKKSDGAMSMDTILEAKRILKAEREGRR